MTNTPIALVLGNSLTQQVKNTIVADTAPTHVSHPMITALCDSMRLLGRTELVHYAGACYRDAVAWQLCRAWFATPALTESELKSRALRAAGWGDVSPADLRASNPGMR